MWKMVPMCYSVFLGSMASISNILHLWQISWLHPWMDIQDKFVCSRKHHSASKIKKLGSSFIGNITIGKCLYINVIYLHTQTPPWKILQTLIDILDTNKDSITFNLAYTVHHQFGILVFRYNSDFTSINRIIVPLSRSFQIWPTLSSQELLAEGRMIHNYCLHARLQGCNFSPGWAANKINATLSAKSSGNRGHYWAIHFSYLFSFRNTQIVPTGNEFILSGKIISETRIKVDPLFKYP